MASGFVYLVAVVDVFSRRDLSRRVDTMEADFCIEAMREALAKHGKPEIFNNYPGSQFTSADFTRRSARCENRDQHGRQGRGARGGGEA